jgi:hypothetical protein
MEVTVENEKIKVNSSYNKSFVTRAKQIQGKWNAPYWVFPEENREEVKALLVECYGECGELGTVSTVTIELDLDAYTEGDEDGEIRVGSMVVLKRRYRDSEVVFSDNAMLISGGFATSGGSVKYPSISANEGTIIRVKKVPETIFNKIKDHEGVKLVSDIDVESLKVEREKLLKRLAEIDSLLAT